MHDMEIVPVPILSDNYLWVIISSDRKEVIAVDPGEYQPLRAFLESKQLTLSAVLITHHHHDHIGGLDELLHHHQVPVYGPSHLAQVTHKISELEPIVLGNLSFQVLYIPGHTLDHVAYLLADHLFCGDTLFSAGCGRVFEGTFSQMYESLQKISALSDNTKIYCAHEYTLANLKFARTVEPNNSDIAEKIKQTIQLRESNHPTLPSVLHEEKLMNPFLRCHIPEVIHQVEQHSGLELSQAVDVFEQLRRWKDTF